MSMQLSPCVECSRHVKQSDATCPFCGATRSPRFDLAPARTAAARLSRAALFTAGALGVGATTADCSMGQALYGGSIPSEVGDSSTSPDTGTETGSADSGGTTGPADASSASTDALNAADVPMAVAAYGAAIIVDSGAESDDAPSFVALYGGFAPVDGGIK
jgi:hypothetical protein